MHKLNQALQQMLLLLLLFTLTLSSARADSLALPVEDMRSEFIYILDGDSQAAYAMGMDGKLYRYLPGEDRLTALPWTHTTHLGEEPRAFCMIDGGACILLFGQNVLHLVYSEKQGLPESITLPYPKNIKGAAAGNDVRRLCQVGQALFFMLDPGDRDSYLLVRFDLDTKQIKAFDSSRGLQNFIPLQGGQMLLSDSVYEKERLFGRLRVLDTQSGKITKQIDLPERAEALAHDADSGDLLFISQSALWRWDCTGQPQQLRKLPVSGNGMPNPGIMMQGKLLSAYMRGLFLADPKPPTGGSLHFIGEAPGGSYHGGAYDQFMLSNPDIQLSYQYSPDMNQTLNTGELGQRIQTGMLPFDIMVLNTQTLNLAALIKKGFCMELSDDPELMEAVARMYPSIKEQVIVDGKLYGLPARVDSLRAMTYFKPSLDSLGLTPDDLPTSLVGLAQMVANWRSFPGNQDIRPFEVKDALALLRERFIGRYLALATKDGQQLQFTDPIFVDGLNQIDQLRYPRFPDQQPMVFSDGGSDLFSVEVMPLSLTDEGQPVAPARLFVYFVSSASKNREQALSYLRLACQSQQDRYKAALYPDWTKPVVQPDYPQWLQEQQQEEARLEQALKTATGSQQQRRAQEQLDSHRARFAASQDFRQYAVSPAGLLHYQQHLAPYLVFPPINPFTSPGEPGAEAIQKDISRYLKGQLSARQLAELLDQKARLMHLEGEAD